MSFQDQVNTEETQRANLGRRFQFYKEPVEDRTASIDAGHVVFRDQERCRVFKVGGNGDYVEWIIEELPPEKLALLGDAYKAWKAGEADPVSGTPLKMCPLYSPADVANLNAHHILTVEQHAAVPDGLLGNLGMGARAARDKANAWLNSANDVGKVAQQNAALQQQVSELSEQLGEALKAIALLQTDKPKRGRPPKVVEEEEEAA